MSRSSCRTSQTAHLPGDIGIYEYRGRRQWTNRSDDAGRYFAVRRFA